MLSLPSESQVDVRQATPDGAVKVTRTGQLADGTRVSDSYDIRTQTIKSTDADGKLVTETQVFDRQ